MRPHLKTQELPTIDVVTTPKHHFDPPSRVSGTELALLLELWPDAKTHLIGCNSIYLIWSQFAFVEKYDGKCYMRWIRHVAAKVGRAGVTLIAEFSVER